MTFFATLLFGAGSLLLISALENTSITQTLGSILAGDITVTPAASTSPSSNAPSNPNVSGPTAPTAPVQTS